MAVLHDAESVARQAHAAEGARTRQGRAGDARGSGVCRALGPASRWIRILGSGYLTLTTPGRHFASATLTTKEISPSTLLRISRYDTGEPYFGRSGGNRFDDPRKRGRYGTCYFGFDLHCAFAETVLHDEVADLELGGFPLVTTELERYVLSFTGRPLNVAVLHGVPLKNLGGDGALSTVVPYDIPQQWSAAVYRHRQHVDGFLYMSRHLNTSEALVLFDRAAPRLELSAAVPFRDHPAAARVLRDFNILPR
ncbi:RES family NAD+ phosphorylase [Burkholderia multivorans]|uniref:RES family NAD+ phosphorylase n=1 Tax=Burkholderia multivorans TaxID=87883 RepID=UPI0020B3CF31|nr:RES family NAD+ phosphorylase [Burkholderia multivorans]